MIRRATSYDAKKIAELDSLIFVDHLGLDFIENDLNNNDMANYFVYEIDGQIVGYILCWITDNTQILNFGVIEEYRGQGIGQALFDEMLKHKIGVLTLEVRESNLKAIRFYEKNGMVAVLKREHYYSNGESALLMIRK